MMMLLIKILLVVYVLVIGLMLLNSFFDAQLIYHFFKKRSPEKKLEAFEKLPMVTIQLPIYNEMFVAERLLLAVAALDYPKSLLEIQVLDDSTDETSKIIAATVSAIKAAGIGIQHIQRTNRRGYKAGALRDALASAKGEFIAIFDADFVPSIDFLQKTIPHFQEGAIGMVQAKWGHLNKKESLLGRLQAIALDGHFSLEQQARNSAGYFINFNGTAGVWRKATILDAGNWQADTLTEDFDLSYRAQLKGWKFKYLEELTTPSELPPMISAMKSQQFRWTKGGAETAKKNLKPLLRASLPLRVKLHGAFHLTYSFGFVSIIIYALLTVPLLFVKDRFPQYNLVFILSNIVTVSFMIYTAHYFIAFLKNNDGSYLKRSLKFLLQFPLFVSLFIGISLSNAIAILQGYAGIKSGFVRTPKFSNMNNLARLKSKYANPAINWMTFLEALLVAYFAWGIATAIRLKNYGAVPLLVMAMLGFGMVVFMSFAEGRVRRESSPWRHGDTDLHRDCS
ncbi:MAG: cellulose synthase family protein [Chitinophagaceae bacterium]